MSKNIKEKYSYSNEISNKKVIDNFTHLKLSIFIIPLLFLLIIVLFLYCNESLSIKNYIDLQKDCFFYLNSKLSEYPNALINLTQIGDEFIFLTFLSVLFVNTPKVWEALISASLVSALISFLFKRLFAVPRPAAIFDHEKFTIIGETLSGRTSLPSGHSITVFTLLTVLLFAFMPKPQIKKAIWCFLIFTTGFVLVFTRVGVGAHYPLDVIVGSIIGFFCGLIGIFLTRKYFIFNWIENKKYYPFFILLFFSSCIVLINKILSINLFVYYMALIFLAISLIKTTSIYVKK